MWIGIGMLALGILYHVQFMRGLRNERAHMKLDGLIHGESSFPVSLTLLTALAPARARHRRNRQHDVPHRSAGLIDIR